MYELPIESELVVVGSFCTGLLVDEIEDNTIGLRALEIADRYEVACWVSLTAFSMVLGVLEVPFKPKFLRLSTLIEEAVSQSRTLVK